MKKSETWNHITETDDETPKEMIDFFNEIEEVCKKHNLSITHEDPYGGFVVEIYKESNIEWLREASKRY